MSSVSTSSSAAVQLYGLASGLDWSTIVNKLVQIEQAPETLLNSQKTQATNRSADFTQIGKYLTSITTDLTSLNDPNFYTSRSATTSDTSKATAKADNGTAIGNYAFNIINLATSSVQQGTIATGKALSPTNDVSALTLASAGFANPVTAGTFTVNNQIVTISTSDTLQGVFDKISTATGGTVTGSYNASTDEISLNSSSTIVLGSSNDTSNFIASAALFNNGTGTVTSTSALGGINQSAPLSSANFSTTISDGGSGAGSFSVNGVAISYNASKDSVNDVLQRINDSTAGVVASYDSLNDRFLITNKTQGDLGLSLQDTTGNFLSALGISGGTLQRGSNLQYKINNGATLTSRSNTIDSTSSGLKGLTVSALNTGTFNVSIGTDTTKISSAITQFVTDYNSVQSFISAKTKTSTDSSGNITAGDLTGNLDAEGLATTLRHLVDGTPLSGVISNLGSIGINSNGNDNTLSTPDATTLANALANNLDSVKSLFTKSGFGIADTLKTFLNNFNGINGALQTNITAYQKRITDINSTIANLEAKIAKDRTRITQEFVNYENVANNTASQKSYLTSFFSGSTSATSSNTGTLSTG